MKKSFGKKLSLGILVSLLAGTGLWFLVGATKSPSANVKTSKVKRETFQQIVSISGNLATARKSDIVATYNGYIKKLYVSLGQKVKQGDPLLVIVQSLQVNDEAFPIRAPIDGLVVQVNKSEGDRVDATTILRIEDRSKILIVGNISEVDRPRIQVGQSATVRVVPISNKVYKGVIRKMFSSPPEQKDSWNSNKSIEYPVVIEILDPDEQLQTGMSSFADIEVLNIPNVLTLRHEYIYRQKDETYVILKNGEKRNIVIGNQNDELVEIKEGLLENEEVQMVDYASLDKEV